MSFQLPSMNPSDRPNEPRKTDRTIAVELLNPHHPQIVVLPIWKGEPRINPYFGWTSDEFVVFEGERLYLRPKGLPLISYRLGFKVDVETIDRLIAEGRLKPVDPEKLAEPLGELRYGTIKYFPEA